jgi:hypothetical protein
MEVTHRVMSVNRDRGPGRIEFRADPSLTRYAGLAVCGELCRNLRMVELVDAELQAARVSPVKARRRGLSPGQLTVAIAECQLAGAECFDDLEDVRADRAGAELRAVAGELSAPTARQLACRFKPSHIRAIERGVARAGNELDRKLGRDPAEAVTFDLDASETKVFGRNKRGAGRSRHGHLAYHSYAVTWADRGRALTSELKGGNQARIKAAESGRMLGRAERLLPEGHGQITVRGVLLFGGVDAGLPQAQDALHLLDHAHVADVVKARRDRRARVDRCDRHAWRAGRRASVSPRRAGSTSRCG